MIIIDETSRGAQQRTATRAEVAQAAAGGDRAALTELLAGRTTPAAVAKAADPHRQRRDQTIADVEQRVTDQLGRLAAELVHGTRSSAAFLDDAVEVMRQGIRAGLAHGANHAHQDRAAVKASIPVPPGSFPVPAGTGGRYHLYAGAVTRGYEQGYGLAALGTAKDPDMIRVSWHAKPGACELCAGRDGKLFTVATLPGWPGEGGFGGPLCMGGPNCRCSLRYRTVAAADAADEPAQIPPRPGPPEPVVAPTPVQQRLAGHVDAARQAFGGDDPHTAFDLLLDELATDAAELQRPYLAGFAQDLIAVRNRTQTPAAVEARWTRRPDNDDGGWLLPAAFVAAAIALALHAQAQSQATAAPATVGAPTTGQASPG